MEEKSTDQKWQQLHTRIEKLLGKYLKDDLQLIDYQPRYVIPFLELPSKAVIQKAANEDK
jgi:hypothetical protein